MTIEWKNSTGLLGYEETVKQMEQRVAEISSRKNNELVWLLEHPPLYTAGTSAKKNDLLEPNKFPVYYTGRGGQFTYHGPGQRVAYVMLNLQERGAQDAHAYVNNIEQWVINTLQHFDIQAKRKKGHIGVWVEQNGREAKIAAIGIRIKKWVTYHGVAINLMPNLLHFNGIIPCGIAGFGVTSIAALGKEITLQELDSVLKKEFSKIF